MRLPRLVLAATVGSLALVATSCGSGGNDTASAKAATAEQLSFTAAEVGGGTFDATSIEGKDTVLWFWAPWCTICRGEAPDVVASVATVGDKVQLIGVAGRGEEPAMEAFVADTGTGGLRHIVDADGSIWSSFNVAAQPAYAFIDDKGSVEVHIGVLGRDALTKKMQALASS